MSRKKLIRITTVPLSLDKLLGEQLSFMNRHFDITAVSSSEKELKKVAEKFGIRYFSIEMTRRITPLKDLKSFWKMYKFLKKENPEIVHTHTPKAGLIGMMASYFAKVPIRLHTVAGLPLLEASGSKRIVLNLVEKLTYSFATKVYPNSCGLKEIILKEKFCNQDKLKVIGNGSSNGIDLNHFNPEKISEIHKKELKGKLEISDEDFVFIFIGRLVKDKGINELVKAFSYLDSQFSNLKLLLVGPFEQDLDPISEAAFQKIKENTNIIEVGFQQDVRPYFSISDVLVFPSYREGFPNVVLQAGAMGLPSIVSDINGCNEIVSEGINGLIVPPKKVEELQKAMLELYKNQNLRSEISKNSRAIIASKYSQQLVWDSLKSEYDSLISEKNI